MRCEWGKLGGEVWDVSEVNWGEWRVNNIHWTLGLFLCVCSAINKLNKHFDIITMTASIFDGHYQANNTV